MPGPVSLTENRTPTAWLTGEVQVSTRTLTCPAGVNLTPLPSKFINTWRSLPSSLST